jgi:molybdopterin-containing oxidoreductase family iron-sulfur binding subunit
MEKCTYCVQRINQARIQAKIEGRPIKDGEIVTACQQACPSGAIVFGNMRDKESKVYAIKNGDPRNYGILTELNTKPRTTYLGKVSNPNGEVKA